MATAVADCDLMNFSPERRMPRVRERAGRRNRHDSTHGRHRPLWEYHPFALDARGLAVGSAATTQCGRTEVGIPAAVQAYCATLR